MLRPIHDVLSNNGTKAAFLGKGASPRLAVVAAKEPFSRHDGAKPVAAVSALCGHGGLVRGHTAPVGQASLARFRQKPSRASLPFREICRAAILAVSVVIVSSSFGFGRGPFPGLKSNGIPLCHALGRRLGRAVRLPANRRGGPETACRTCPAAPALLDFGNPRHLF